MSIKRFFGFGKSKPDDNPNPEMSDSVILKDLSRIPLADRDLDWDRKYLKHAPKAKLACRIPQVQHESNGFPYFQLEIPDVNQPFQAYTIDELIISDLLRDGIGACIYSYDKTPDVLLSYGELLNYHSRGSFRSNIKNWIPPTPHQFNEMNELMGGNPNEAILHPYSREVIRTYLKGNNINSPKVSLLNIMTEHGLMNQLVFNLEPHMFDDEKHFQACLSSLAWFLPMHYTYTAIPERFLEELFFNL